MIQTSRCTFECFVAGEGEPLCVTHLYSEFNERGTYFADPFTSRFRVYLVNLREAGQSVKAKEDEQLSMKESVRDLEAIREALGYNRWVFAGHSTGGMLGLVYGHSYTESLTKMVVGGAAASNAYMRHEGSMYATNSPLNKRLKELFAIIKSDEASSEEKREANRAWTDLSLYRPAQRAEYFKRPSSGKVVPRRLDYYSFKELPHFNLTEELNCIHVPTFVFCGQHDTQCPVEFSEAIHEGLPHSELYIFKESNHFPFLEEETKFDKMIDQFIQFAYR